MKKSLISIIFEIEYRIEEKMRLVLKKNKENVYRINLYFTKFFTKFIVSKGIDINKVFSSIHSYIEIDRNSSVLQHSIIKYFIPSKRREEVMGDLTETRNLMLDEGMKVWQIKIVISWHIFWVMTNMLKIKFSDFGVSSKKEIDKGGGK